MNRFFSLVSAGLFAASLHAQQLSVLVKGDLELPRVNLPLVTARIYNPLTGTEDVKMKVLQAAQPAEFNFNIKQPTEVKLYLSDKGRTLDHLKLFLHPEDKLELVIDFNQSQESIMSFQDHQRRYKFSGDGAGRNSIYAHHGFKMEAHYLTYTYDNPFSISYKVKNRHEVDWKAYVMLHHDSVYAAGLRYINSTYSYKVAGFIDRLRADLALRTFEAIKSTLSTPNPPQHRLNEQDYRRMFEKYIYPHPGPIHTQRMSDIAYYYANKQVDYKNYEYYDLEMELQAPARFKSIYVQSSTINEYLKSLPVDTSLIL